MFGSGIGWGTREEMGGPKPAIEVKFKGKVIVTSSKSTIGTVVKDAEWLDPFMRLIKDGKMRHNWTRSTGKVLWDAVKVLTSTRAFINIIGGLPVSYKSMLIHEHGSTVSVPGSQPSPAASGNLGGMIEKGQMLQLPVQWNYGHSRVI